MCLADFLALQSNFLYFTNAKFDFTFVEQGRILYYAEYYDGGQLDQPISPVKS
jgi:hypothetical protein